MSEHEIPKKEPRKHLTHQDQIKFQSYLKQGLSVPEAGTLIGCSRSTAYHEYNRGLVGPLLRSDWSTYYAYDADRAQAKYDENGTAKGPQVKLGNHYDFAEFIAIEIKNQRSPVHALEAARRSGQFEITVCHATLYRYISNGYIPGIQAKDLPMAGKLAKKQRKVEPRRVKPLQRSIEDRPEAINNREEFGHWELDTVIGKAKGDKPVLAVFTERKTRAEIIRKIPEKTQEAIKLELDKLEWLFGRNFSKVFRSITMDNGTELSDDKGIEKSIYKTVEFRTVTYYCHPYRSTERASNENQNRHIRRRIPKGTPISSYTEKYIMDTEYWLNTMHRCTLDKQTAAERFITEIEQLGIKIKKKHTFAWMQ